MKRLIALISLMTFVVILAGCEGKQSVDQSPSQSAPEITTAAVTRDSKDCVGADYQLLGRELCEAGFLYVDVEAIDDLTSSDTERVGVIESVSINGETDFAKGQEFDKESSIVIRYHDYRNCTVAIHVDFVSNWLLNKYDVNFLVDDIIEGTMEHGTDSDFELFVKAGTYTLSFESDESSSVKGTTTIVIDGDAQINYQISCYGEEVAVKTVSTEILECTTSEHTWNDATCIKPNTCSVCGKTEGEALGHKWIDATCTAAKTCSICQETDGEPLGHNVSEWTVLQGETCGTDGAKTGVCSVCSEKVEEIIPQTGAHAYSDWKVTLNPSCTTEGTQARVCNTCQYEDTSKIERLSHEYVESIIAEATYYDAGTKGQKCSACGIEGETNKYYTYYETSLRKIFDAY